MNQKIEILVPASAKHSMDKTFAVGSPVSIRKKLL